MADFFNTILTEPLFNALIFLYNIIPGKDFGIAIVVLTIIIKLLLYPLSQQSIKSQKALAELQPKMDEIKKRYKNDKETQAKELMNLYRKEKINPLSSCLPLLIQLPFLIAVFHVFRVGFEPQSMDMLYSFVARPELLNPVSFGFLNLANSNIALAVITGLAQFWQTKMLTHRKQPKVSGAKDEDMMAQLNRQMLYFMPVMTAVIGASLPAGLVLYWLTTTLLTIVQQKITFGIMGKDKKNNPEVLPAEKNEQ